MPTLANEGNCTGCAACYNSCNHGALSMVANEEGFLFPKINIDKCIECKLCERSCPVITPQKNNHTNTPRAFAVWNEHDRCISSSGGAFSSFARYIISKGGIVYGAAFDKHLYLRHQAAETLEELEVLRGSKYIQSDIGNTFKDIRKNLLKDRWVLFCGTPCQVAGLRNYLHKDYEHLLLLDLACHGVPSNGIWKSYLQKLSALHANVPLSHFEFRRRNGWGFAPSASIKGKLRPLYGVEALYMEAFDKSALFRKSCYQCQYACPQRIGDCSLADFWGIGRQGVPFKHNVMKGVSLVLANNAKGNKMLHDLPDTFIEERPLTEALAENGNLNHPSILHVQRNQIIEAFLNQKVTLKDIDRQFKIVNRSIKGYIKHWTSKLHLFEIVKRIHIFYKEKF